MTDRSTEVYLGNGLVAALPAFIWTWWYCAEQFGFLWGFGFGWLPAIILAMLICFIWPVAIVVFLVALLSPAYTIDGTFWTMARGIAGWELVVAAIYLPIVAISTVASALENARERRDARKAIK